MSPQPHRAQATIPAVALTGYVPFLRAAERVLHGLASRAEAGFLPTDGALRREEADKLRELADLIDAQGERGAHGG